MENTNSINFLLNEFNVPLKLNSMPTNFVYSLNISCRLNNGSTIIHSFHFFDEKIAKGIGELLEANYKKYYTGDKPYFYYSVWETCDTIFF